MGQRVTGPYRAEAEEQLAEGVERGGGELAAAREREGVQAERRESRKPAQEADHDERPSGFTDVNAARGDEAGNDADREATHHVHQEDPQRKASPEPRLDDVVGEVAKEGAHSAADGDRQ